MHKFNQILIVSILIISLLLFVVSIGFIHSLRLFLFDDVLFALITFYNLIVSTYYISRNSFQKLDCRLLIINIIIFVLFVLWYKLVIK